MSNPFEITTPLPARGSATALRQQLIEHLERSRPRVGDRFLSDFELTQIARLSRPTVRRALDDLQREGWIERRPGVGTFIGPRAGMFLDQPNGHDGKANGGTRQRTVRLALLVHLLGDFVHDWYVAGLIAGIDAAAEETGVSLELLGHRDGEVAAAVRRLGQSKPDVLAFAAPALRHSQLIGEARRLSIPCIGTGTLMASLGLPSIVEDGEDGARRAVKLLVEQGHRRIGLISPTFPLPWIFQRRNGYLAGLNDAGIEHDEGLTLWLETHDTPDAAQQLQRYLERRKPTAVLLSSWVIMQTIWQLVRDGGLSIPRDLSVVSFDQHQSMESWMGHVKPTTVNMPLLEMGRRLALMARQVADGKLTDPTPLTLPCPLSLGDSVGPPSKLLHNAEV
jgi:LacI family transcriptional regulator